MYQVERGDKLYYSENLLQAGFVPVRKAAAIAKRYTVTYILRHVPL